MEMATKVVLFILGVVLVYMLIDASVADKRGPPEVLILQNEAAPVLKATHIRSYNDEQQFALETGECANILPAIARMSRGVDITTLDLIPSNLLQPNGYKHVLFDFTCKHNRTWHHPTIVDYVYDQPDQVQSIMSVPAAALNIKTSFHSTLKDYKESYAVKVGVNYKFGVFSASGEYSQAREDMISSNESIVEVGRCI